MDVGAKIFLLKICQQICCFVLSQFVFVLQVSVCNTATVIYTAAGNLYILANHSSKKIARTLSPPIQKLLSFGPSADLPSQEAPLPLLPSSTFCFPSQDLFSSSDHCVYFLQDRSISLWTSSLQSFVRLDKGSWVDICATRSFLLAIDSYGDVYQIILPTTSNIGLNYQKVVLPYLFRCKSIFSSPDGENLIALTNDSIADLPFPSFSVRSTVGRDMGSLTSDTPPFDEFADVYLISKGKNFPAHQYVLAAHSAYFRKRLHFNHSDNICNEKNFSEDPNDCKIAATDAGCNCRSFSFVAQNIKESTAKEGQEPPILKMDFIEPEVLEEVLSFIYSGICPRLQFPLTQLWSGTWSPNGLLDKFSSRKSFEGFARKVASAAYILGVDLISNFQGPHGGMRLHSLSAVKQDVVFQCADGLIDQRSPGGHKVVLAARNEYFAVLFASRWSFGNQMTHADGRQIVRMTTTSRAAMLLLLQFIYSGDCCLCNASLSLAQQLYLLADEVLCIPCRILAEKSIAQNVGPHNFVALKQFADASQAALLQSYLHGYALRNFPLIAQTNIQHDYKFKDFASYNKFSETLFATDYDCNDLNMCFDSVSHSYPLPGLGSNLSLTADSPKSVAPIGLSSSKLTSCIARDPVACCQLADPELYKAIMASLGTDLGAGELQGYPLGKFGMENKKRRRSRSRRYSSRSSDSSDNEFAADFAAESLDFSDLTDKLEDNNEGDDDWQLVSRKSNGLAANARKKSGSSSSQLNSSEKIVASSPVADKKTESSTCDSKRARKELQTKSKHETVIGKPSVKHSPVSAAAVAESAELSNEKVAESAVATASSGAEGTSVSKRLFQEQYPALGSGGSSCKDKGFKTADKGTFRKKSQSELKKMHRQRVSCGSSEVQPIESSSPAWNIPQVNDNRTVDRSLSSPACSSPLSSPPSTLASIMKHEKDRQMCHRAVQERDLGMIQLEERAIRELLQHYKMLGSSDDDIEVLPLPFVDDTPEISSWSLKKPSDSNKR